MSDFDFEAALAAQVASSQETTADETVEEAPAAETEPEPETVELDDEPDDDEEEEELEPDDLPDTDVEDDTDEPDDDTEEVLLAGRFRSAQELEEAYANLEAKLGQQGTELGELRKLRDEMDELRSQIQQPAPQQQHVSQEWFDEYVDEDPQAAVMWALNNQQQGLFDQAMDAWYETAPRQAAAFERQIEIGALRADLEQRIQPQLQPLQQQHEQRELADRARQLTERYPDFEAVLQSASPEELNGFPDELAGQLQHGDINAKAVALEAMYRWVKATRVSAPADDPARKAQARSAKRKAAVASASSTPARGEKSVQELLAEQMLAPEPYSVAHGLTNG